MEPISSYSRKRKSTATDRQNFISGHSSSKDLKQQKDADLHFETAIEGNARELFSTGTHRLAEPFRVWHQTDSKSHSHSDFAATFRSYSTNVHKTGVENMNCSVLSPQLCYRGHLPPGVSGEILPATTKPQKCDTSGESLSSSKWSTAGKDEANPLSSSQTIKGLGHSMIATSNSMLEVHNQEAGNFDLLSYSCQGSHLGYGDGNISTTESSKLFLVEEFSPKDGSGPPRVVDGQGKDQSHSPLKLDENSKSLIGKEVHAISEMFWNGPLHLNSSVTVPTVAYFKSGEKMPDVKWPEFLEIKGKVRLGAFEKYVQDLSRSRNRGVMVISLCWKGGSSETGLVGMKEVVNGYKKGQKVGVAEISQGVDLYICPHTDTIVTILAKYGFFKGMAATVEDKKDSLIGCVVWRRQQVSSSNSASKKPKKTKEEPLSGQPPNSSSDPFPHNASENKGPPVQQSQKSSPPVLATTVPMAVEGAGNAPNTCTHAPSVSSKPPSFSNELNPSIWLETCSPQWNPRPSIAEAHIKHSSEPGPEPEPDKSPMSVEIQKLVLPFLSDAIKPPVAAPDYDDLPEFDFGAACGISPTPPSGPLINVNALGKKLQDEESTKTRPMPVPQLPPLSDLPGLQRDFNQGVDKSNISAALEEKHAAQTTTFPQPKKLFSDDDDMPEWCPPTFLSHKRSITNNERPLTDSLPFSTTTTFQGLPPAGPSRPLLPSLSFSSQAPFCADKFRPPFHPEHTDGRGPNSMGMNSNSSMRPASKPYDAQFALHPPSQNGWRR